MNQACRSTSNDSRGTPPENSDFILCLTFQPKSLSRLSRSGRSATVKTPNSQSVGQRQRVASLLRRLVFFRTRLEHLFGSVFPWCRTAVLRCNTLLARALRLSCRTTVAGSCCTA